MSLLNNILSKNNSNFNLNSLIEQTPGLKDLFNLTQREKDPKQALLSLINEKGLSKSQLDKIKNMARSMGLSESSLAELDQYVNR